AHPELEQSWYLGATSKAAARSVTVSKGRTTALANQSVPRRDNVPHVEGTVRDRDGQPAAGVHVITHILYGNEGSAEGWSYRTDAQGRFRFPVFAGSYHQYSIRFLPPSGNSYDEWYQRPRNVGIGDSRAQFSLPAG